MGYNRIMAATVGIRELKNNLCALVRRVERGETLTVTAHGRPVALLGPAPPRIAANLAHTPAQERKPPMEGIRPLHLPRGTAQRWLDWDRNGR